MNEVFFFQDLAVLMVAAGFVAVLFSRLGWPKVLGYLLAGVVMNEHTWGGGFLSAPASAQVAGQLGVVFLMFGMGLTFSPREMRKIRTVVLPAALLDTLVMIWLGYTVGTRVFGWSSVQSFFLGVAICDSATTLLAKVIGELGWQRRVFTKYVLGTSVCEDIVCVGAIAVATGFAGTGGMSAMALVRSLGGLGVFFLTVLAFGFVCVPRLLDMVARGKDDESLLLVLLGCGFLVTFIADRLGCSLALGAFLVGVIGGSSDVRDRLVRLLEPLKTMYSAIFFVSIGLLVDPSALVDRLPQVLLVSAVVVVGKFLNVTLAALAAGVEVKTAVQTGLGLAQIGEFAFMVAILYATLTGEAGGEFFTVAVGASLLTTLISPWMVRWSDRAGDFAERMMPRRFVRLMAEYRAWIDKICSTKDSPALCRLRAAAIRLGICAVLVLGMSVLFSLLPRFDFTRFSLWFERHDELVFFLLGNVFILSLLPIVLSGARELGLAVARILIGTARAKWVRPVRQIIRVTVLTVVCVLFFVEWLMLDIANAPGGGVSFGVLLTVFSLTAVFGWRFFARAGRRASDCFREALTAEERRESLAKTMTLTVPEGTVHRFTLGATSPAVGGTVVTLNIRAKTGASIVSVIRGESVTRNVGPEWEFAVGDTLVALGDARQIAALKDLLGITV